MSTPDFYMRQRQSELRRRIDNRVCAKCFTETIGCANHLTANTPLTGRSLLCHVRKQK